MKIRFVLIFLATLVFVPNLWANTSKLQEVVDDVEFNHLGWHLNKFVNENLQGEPLLRPTYKNYLIEYYIRKDNSNLPYEMKQVLEKLGEYQAEELNNPLGQCDKEVFEKQKNRIQNIKYYMDQLNKEALKDYNTIREAYNERYNILQELIGNHGGNEAIKREGNILLGALRVHYGRNHGFHFGKGYLGMVLNTIVQWINVYKEAYSYHQAKIYSGSAMAALKLKLFYEVGVFKRFKQIMSFASGEDQKLRKYDSYFLENGKCALKLHVNHKYEAEKVGNDYKFKWQLSIESGQPISTGMEFRVKRTVGYKQTAVDGRIHQGEKVFTLRSNEDGQLEDFWTPSIYNYMFVKYEILGTNERGYFYEGNGDSIYKQFFDASGEWVIGTIAHVRIEQKGQRLTAKIIRPNNFYDLGTVYFDTEITDNKFLATVVKPKIYGCHPYTILQLEGELLDGGGRLRARWVMPNGCASDMQPHVDHYWETHRISR